MGFSCRPKCIFKLLLVVTMATVVIQIISHYSEGETNSWKSNHLSTNSKVYSVDAAAKNEFQNQGSSSKLKYKNLSTILDEETHPKAKNPSHQYLYRYILNNPGKCKTDYRLKLVMIIISAPSNNNSRLAIRRTWGTATLRRDVTMVFLLGATNDTSLQNRIVQEDNLYGDIVQEDFMDSYLNLTLKSIALLRWVNSFCRNAEFVLKVDDDNFVHVPNLLTYLETMGSARKSILGNLVTDCIVNRDKSSKWYISKEDLPDDTCPHYLGGPAYVMTQDCVEDLLNATRVVKPISVEDLYITGLCAEHANISRLNHPEFHGTMNSFYMLIYTYFPSTYRKLFTAHTVPYTSYFSIWQVVNTS